MAEPSKKEYPEVLVAIADHVAQFLVNRGIPESEAARVGLDCAEYIRRAFGGDDLYIPKAISFELSKRDAEILDKFDGSNFKEITREYGITRRRLYQILHSVREGRQGFLDLEGRDDGRKA